MVLKLLPVAPWSAGVVDKRGLARMGPVRAACLGRLSVSASSCPQHPSLTAALSSTTLLLQHNRPTNRLAIELLPILNTHQHP
jgi:hypothetical protein